MKVYNYNCVIVCTGILHICTYIFYYVLYVHIYTNRYTHRLGYRLYFTSDLNTKSLFASRK